MLAPANRNDSLALGTMAMTGCYGPVDREQAVATIQSFLDRGLTFIDTADLYADGSNERLLGGALRGRREQATVCTKFGFTFGVRSDERGLDARPERVEAACDASLTRLGLDTIDLYYLHRIDPKVPLEDTVGAMSRLVEKGKVRWLGLCEVSRQSLLRAIAVHPVSAVQSEYSLWSRDPEDDILGACSERGIRFFGYASLGRGFLTGQIRSAADIPPGDQRHEYPRFQGENFGRNLQLVEEVKRQAAQLGVTPAQLALAWTRRNDNVVPIAGCTTVEQVAENMAALALRISPEQMDRLDAIVPRRAWAGARYPESALRRLDPTLSLPPSIPQ